MDWINMTNRNLLAFSLQGFISRCVLLVRAFVLGWFMVKHDSTELKREDGQPCNKYNPVKVEPS